MNYYEHHLGDYAREAGHLTMLEHGAYRLLLDRYYSTGAGIPANKAHRLARARTKDDTRAVDTVLEEFFELIDGVWIHHRVEREIAQYRAKFDAARENGKKGGRPKDPSRSEQQGSQEEPKRLEQGTKEEPDGLAQITQDEPEGLAQETQEEPNGLEQVTQVKAHQTPDTNPQTPDTNPQKTHTGQAMAVKKTAAACVAMRSEGMHSVNTSHPELLRLIADGAEVQEFVDAARAAVAKGKGFSYALGIVKGCREDARRLAQTATSTAKARKTHSDCQAIEPI